MNGAPGMVGLDEEELIRVNYFPIAICGSRDAESFLRGRYPPALFDATTVIVDAAMEADTAAAARRTAASHFVVMTEAQRRAIAAARPEARCAVLPLDVEATTSRPLAREARSDIVMLCDNLDGSAAAAAVTEMLQAIVPALSRACPDVRVRFNGGPLAAELIGAMPSGLEVLPTSAPIGTVLDRARVVVIPQHWCAPDTLSNVAEARARGIPVVATSGVLRGARLSDGVDAVIADTPDALVDVIARVHSDPWYWASLAGASHAAAAAPDAIGHALAVWASGAAVVGGNGS
jgi:hypothetical protein